MVTNIDKGCIDLTGYYECAGKPQDPKWLRAYLDSGGVWTIGIGCIKYPNGSPVKKGDTITPQERDEYFVWEMRDKVAKVNQLTRDDINQQQFNAIVDLTFNIGTTALQKSTLLKVLNANLSDPILINRFMDWRFDNGKEIPGLLRRRMSDAYMYFTGLLKTDWVNYKTLSASTIPEVKNAIKSANK